jgi:hypothetical protein
MALVASVSLSFSRAKAPFKLLKEASGEGNESLIATL